MAASLVYCLRIIEDLERHITNLEFAASRKTTVARMLEKNDVWQEQRREHRA